MFRSRFSLSVFILAVLQSECLGLADICKDRTAVAHWQGTVVFITGLDGHVDEFQVNNDGHYEPGGGLLNCFPAAQIVTYALSTSVDLNSDSSFAHQALVLADRVSESPVLLLTHSLGGQLGILVAMQLLSRGQLCWLLLVEPTREASLPYVKQSFPAAIYNRIARVVLDTQTISHGQALPCSALSFTSVRNDTSCCNASWTAGPNCAALNDTDCSVQAAELCLVTGVQLAHISVVALDPRHFSQPEFQRFGLKQPNPHYLHLVAGVPKRMVGQLADWLPLAESCRARQVSRTVATDFYERAV